VERDEKDSRPLFRVAVALGSNLGDRRAHLDYAVDALSLDLTDIKCSSIIETPPEGVGDEHGPYLNAVVVGLTALSARHLLDRLLEIEEERGRRRPYPSAPRTLDLDLILYEDAVIDEGGLVVPHPRFRERRFVLTPLSQIAPDMVDPVTSRTVSELESALRA
jgi:2-amino-4-hydroxy-6-hydroxymethyldihydropteridine diphosphokinase